MNIKKQKQSFLYVPKPWLVGLVLGGCTAQSMFKANEHTMQQMQSTSIQNDVTLPSNFISISSLDKQFCQKIQKELYTLFVDNAIKLFRLEFAPCVFSDTDFIGSSAGNNLKQLCVSLWNFPKTRGQQDHDNKLIDYLLKKKNKKKGHATSFRYGNALHKSLESLKILRLDRLGSLLLDSCQNKFEYGVAINKIAQPLASLSLLYTKLCKIIQHNDVFDQLSHLFDDLLHDMEQYSIPQESAYQPPLRKHLARFIMELKRYAEHDQPSTCQSTVFYDALSDERSTPSDDDTNDDALWENSTLHADDVEAESSDTQTATCQSEIFYDIPPCAGSDCYHNQSNYSDPWDSDIINRVLAKVMPMQSVRSNSAQGGNVNHGSALPPLPTTPPPAPPNTPTNAIHHAKLCLRLPLLNCCKSSIQKDINLDAVYNKIKERTNQKFDIAAIQQEINSYYQYLKLLIITLQRIPFFLEIDPANFKEDAAYFAMGKQYFNMRDLQFSSVNIDDEFKNILVQVSHKMSTVN